MNKSYTTTTMGKKTYQKPQTEALSMEAESILAGSGITGNVVSNDEEDDDQHPGGMGWDNSAKRTSRERE